MPDKPISQKYFSRIFDPAAYLEVYILGGTVGESIVLRLPGGGVGVVDCYSADLKVPDSNPTVRLLKELEVEELEFLCLTHPHADHFRGMSHLIEHYSPKHFWYYGAGFLETVDGEAEPEPTEIAKHIDEIQTELTSQGLSESRESSSEFRSIWEKLAQLKKKRGLRYFPVKQVRPTTILYPHPYAESPRLKIMGLAPSDGVVIEYHRAEKNGLWRMLETILGNRPPYRRHNRVSAVLRIDFGETRIILGGDLETEGWHVLLQQFRSPESLACHMVKVSHHGSSSGYHEQAWTHKASGGKPISVVTSYKRHGLPDPLILKKIRNNSSRVLLTHREVCDSSREGTSTGASASTDKPAVRLDAAAVLLAHAGNLIPSPPYGAGCWRLVFDDRGNCCESSAAPPAAEHEASQISS